MKKYLFFILLGCFFYACQNTDSHKQQNAQPITHPTNVQDTLTKIQSEKEIRQKEIEEKFTRHKKYVTQFEPCLNLYELADTMSESAARRFIDYQASLSVECKQNIKAQYLADSLKTARAIALIILKRYYTSAFRAATEDVRSYIETPFKPHLQTEIDIDSAAVRAYPLAYFFLRYLKMSTYEMSKAELLLLVGAHRIIKSHPKLKNHPPIKKMLQKLAKKKWDGED